MNDVFILRNEDFPSRATLPHAHSHTHFGRSTLAPTVRVDAVAFGTTTSASASADPVKHGASARHGSRVTHAVVVGAA